jgi:hypothetical protein
MNLIFEDYITEFLDKTKTINYRQNGAFKSELFVIYCLHKYFGSQSFLESGLDSGMSTSTLLELIDCEYVGIDLVPNCGASKIEKPNFRFIHGDGYQYLINSVTNNKETKYSIFVDGPKGETAISLKNQLLLNDNVMFVALHDTYDGLENEHTDRIFETRSNQLYSKKYFDVLNQRDSNDIVTIYNLENIGNFISYYECYPTGPGVSIYSKNNVNFII